MCLDACGGGAQNVNPVLLKVLNHSEIIDADLSASGNPVSASCFTSIFLNVWKQTHVLSLNNIWNVKEIK